MARQPTRLPSYLRTQDITNWRNEQSFIVYKEGTYTIAVDGDTGREVSKNTNPSTVIQYAIDAADDTVGASIHVKKGRYTGMTGLTVAAAQKRITLQGEGPATVFVPSITSGKFIYVLGAHDPTADERVVLRDFAIEATTGTENWTGIYLKNRHYTTVENIYIKGTSDAGDYLRGIYLEACDNTSILNNHIYGCKWGIYFLSGDEDVIANNVLGNINLNGIVIDSPCFKNTIANNTIEECAYVGIYLLGQCNTIIGNTCGECGRFGIYLQSAYCIDNMVIGNSCIDNGLAGTGYGINVESDAGAGNMIVGNTCQNGVATDQDYGIRDQSNLCMIIGNSCRDNVIAQIQGAKIFYNSGYVTENWGSSTGTGSQQTIAHGLAATPTLVLLSDKELNAIPYQSAAADGTNIYVLAAINQDYSWYVRV